MYNFVGDENAMVGLDLLEMEETLERILAVCPNDRHREAVLRTLLGQTMYEIAGHLGVTESRISQMLAKVKHLFQHGEAVKTWKPGSLTVNWR